MVFSNKYTQILVLKFSNFKRSKFFHDEIEDFNEENCSPNTHSILTALSRYVVYCASNTPNKVSEEEKEIYMFINKYRNDFYNFPENTDEGEFDNAICTCFLENLLNYSSYNDFDLSRILPFLTNKSLVYCKEWDKFTGIRSPNLWVDSEWEEDKKK